MHPAEIVRQPLDPDPVRVVDPRDGRGAHVHDDVVLVQDPVVLEVVQQRRRHDVGVAGQEDGGVGHAGRRAALELADQVDQRQAGVGLVEDQPRCPRTQVHIATMIPAAIIRGT